MRSGNKTHQWHELVEILIGSWKDPYNGLLRPLYNWIVFQFFTSIFTSNNQGFGHPDIHTKPNAPNFPWNGRLEAGRKTPWCGTLSWFTPPTKTNGWNLKKAPLEKENTSTQTTGFLLLPCWLSAVYMDDEHDEFTRAHHEIISSFLQSPSCASYSQGPTPSTTPWGYHKKVRVDHPCKGFTSCLLTSWQGVSCQMWDPKQKKIDTQTHKSDVILWLEDGVILWLEDGSDWKKTQTHVVWFDQSIHLGVLMTSTCPSPQTASDCPTALAALVLSASRPVRGPHSQQCQLARFFLALVVLLNQSVANIVAASITSGWAVASACSGRPWFPSPYWSCPPPKRLGIGVRSDPHQQLLASGRGGCKPFCFMKQLAALPDTAHQKKNILKYKLQGHHFFQIKHPHFSTLECIGWLNKSHSPFSGWRRLFPWDPKPESVRKNSVTLIAAFVTAAEPGILSIAGFFGISSGEKWPIFIIC